MVLGYQAAPVLARALPFLQSAGFDIFLHLDAKIDREAYLQTLGSAGQDCQVLNERTDIFWGGYTMMLAGLRLLAAAQTAGPYDRYLLISDDSFPILPPNALAARLTPDDDLITMVHQPVGSQYYERYYKFFFYDHPATMARDHGSRSLEIDEAFENRILEISALRRIGKKKIDVYFGSQFWALTHSTAELLLGTVQHDLHLVKSFEYAALPDELMAQSIIGQMAGENRFSGPVFEDFPNGVGPTVFSAIEQLPPLPVQTLFLRKIDPTATEFIDVMSARLARDLSVLGVPLDLPYFGTAFVDECGDTVVNLRLAAPTGTVKGWHDLEVYLGRAYRWTASHTLEWRFRLPEGPPPTYLQIFLPLVIEDRPQIYEHCYVKVNSKSRRMTHRGGGLNAKLPYSGGEDLHVTVVTPPPVSPRDEDRDSQDDRHLGLSVAI